MYVYKQEKARQAQDMPALTPPVQLKSLLNSFKSSLARPSAPPVQRVVKVGQKTYNSDNSNDLCEAYAKYLGKAPWDIPDLLAEWLTKMAESDTHYTYSNWSGLSGALIPTNGNFLNLSGAAAVHVLAGSRKRIQMTGNRHNDYAAAATSAYPASYPGYTWHHVEGMTTSGGKYYCDMALVESSYHDKISHQGAVWQYEQATRTKYS